MKSLSADLFWRFMLIANIFALSSCHIDIERMLEFNPTENGIEVTFSKDGDIKLVGTIGVGKSFDAGCSVGNGCTSDDINLQIYYVNDGFGVYWQSNTLTHEIKDCYRLNKNEVHWYGGPQTWPQEWPIDNITLDPYTPYSIKYFGVAERYWLNSKGAYIFVDDKAPLFVDQNGESAEEICYIAKLDDPYTMRNALVFNYSVVLEDDPKVAHLSAVRNYLHKPTGLPGERMIREPVWTTWAKYKRDIDAETLVSFAQDIVDNGFNGSQIEVDDNWERCYGSQEFNTEKFPNITDTVKKVKDLDFRLTLWVHPFINDDCEDVASEGLENDYYVQNASGSVAAQWWDGINAYQVDFTNPEAVEWYNARLRNLQENAGIDSFKFDAGEVEYGPPNTIFEHAEHDKIPNIYTESYVRNAAKFGDFIEIRSAWRTQDLPVFVRIMDRESNWSQENGLFSVLTTILQMNMNGYSLVLPDMIGGNGYAIQPTQELLIRWTQLNTFMVSMQLSYMPWDIEDGNAEGIEIMKKFVQLHEEYSDEIISALKANIDNGTPANPSIWWVDPTDPIALTTDDEFLLGESILVAPIVIEGAISRDVYLPKGTWIDGNDGTVYEGPITLEAYPAPLEVLPYFIKQ